MTLVGYRADRDDRAQPRASRDLGADYDDRAPLDHLGFFEAREVTNEDRPAKRVLLNWHEMAKTKAKAKAPLVYLLGRFLSLGFTAFLTATLG